jgi:Ca2+-binding RTX toxin-like protein
VTAISINTSGLSNDMKPQVVQAINKIINDPILRAQINSQAETLTFQFEHKGLVKPDGTPTARAVAGNETPNRTVTFNLDRMGTEDGAVYFDIGSLTKKPFIDNAIHETFHIIYPDLTGPYHDGNPSDNNVIRGQEAAGEFAFRTFTTSTIVRLEHRPGSEEQDRLDAARNELNTNPTTRPDLSGVIWDSYNTPELMRAAVVDKNSIYSAHLLPKAQGKNYDQAPDSNDPWVNREISEDGSSTQSVFDTGAEPWSSETSQFDAYQRLQSQRVVFDDGRQQITKYDPDNTHPYNELEIDEDASGKIIAAKPKIDGQPSNGSTVDFSVVGQVLGSALGRALAPNNQFVQLAASTVIGAVGQKLAQAFAASLATDGASVSFASAFATDFQISIAGAGASSVASFLVAELGTALHLDGFGAQLFNAGAGGFAGSVASQISTKLAQGLSFDAAIGALDFGAAASSAAYGISALLGGYLGHELVPAETHEGAVGGQLLGAIGSAIGISAALSGALGVVLGFIAPGIGSLLGTVLGTLIGDSLAPHPHPAAVDLIDQAGALYGFTHSQVSASDGGDYTIPDPMAAAAVSIINAYLGAVKGIALDHSKQTQIGYVTDPSFRYIDGWTPTHKYLSFVKPDDAVHAAALDILQHTEAIGGDLFLKRAHANSTASIPDPEPEWAGLITPSSQSGAEKLAVLSADLSVAQDYENYLNNREAINALIAANPESAFAAGWIATFARVNELGLNHANASDFLGGLVGYLDSVNKAGLGAEAANATVKRGSDNSVIVEVKIANGAEVPGALSVFADHINVTSDASGQTLQFTVDSGVVANGYHFLGPGASGGDGANDFWIGNATAANTFTGTGGHDILVGGAMNDVIHAGGGWDFVDGGAGNDYLFGEDGGDILRGGKGTDFLYGGQGDDSYVFNRGDGVDTVYDDYRYMELDSAGGLGAPSSGGGASHQVLANGGTDSLLFGPGIARSDIAVQRTGNDLIVGVKDPAHPGAQPTDQITLKDWAIAFNRVENFRFADGATLNLAGGDASLAACLVPFGETLSHNSVAEKSAIGTVVGTVAGFDFAGASLTYSLIDNTARWGNRSPKRNRRAMARSRVRGTGWRHARGATASMACIHKRFA